MRVAITRLDRSLPLPIYQSGGAAGFDLVSRTDVEVPAGEIARIPGNVVIKVPDGHTLLVTLRSGTPKRFGLLCPHGVGVIDQDYAGPDDEILIQVFNFTSKAIVVPRGERIAQGILVPVARCEWDEQAPTALHSRGGFGSTG